MLNRVTICLIGALAASAAVAAPATYTIDPHHTFPSFEAPHVGGISIWRGKIDKTSGRIILDRAGRTGSVDITMETSSIDFGHAKLNEHAKSNEIFDAAKYPTITYKADTIKFDGDTPSEIPGQLTIHGVTKSVMLKINSFKCLSPDPLTKRRERCGADASAEIDRTDFGVNYGVKLTGSGKVKLLIQVEALKDETADPS